MKISQKLIIGTLLMALMIWAVGLFAVNQSRQALRSSIEKSSVVLAREVMDSVDRVIHNHLNQWRVICRASQLQEAIIKSNEAFALLDNRQEVIEQRDRQWASSSDGEPSEFANSVIRADASQVLRDIQEVVNRHDGQEVYSEVFLTNRYGVNVAQTSMTSDYRQDDKQWWLAARDNGVFVGEIMFDQSSQVWSVDICIRIDDMDGAFQGVITAVLRLSHIDEIIHKIKADTLAQDESNSLHSILLLNRQGHILLTSEDIEDQYSDDRIYTHEIKGFGESDAVTFSAEDPEVGEILVTCALSKGRDGIGGSGWLIAVENNAAKIFAPATRLRNEILLIAAIVTTLGLAGGIGLSVSLSRRLEHLRNAANATRDGDLSVRTNMAQSDEIGQLARAFDSMAETLQENDSNIQRNDWLKTGYAQLNDTVRGHVSPESLANAALTFLTEYVGAQVGAIFIVGNHEMSLKMVASYAYQVGKDIPTEVGLGQGLVGQVALEKKTILLTDVPEDYVRISSGLGEVVPRNIVVMPILHNGQLKGVMELGTLNKFDDIQLDFLEQIGPGLGVTFNSVQTRQEVKELLVQSQAQTEELEAQQEELRQSNEELEEQTNELQASEELLKTQQEELEVVNQELEERTVGMEAQRDKATQANDQLKEAWEELELKARELEKSSRYKSEFLANMSHELRTPLNSLMILSKLLAENSEGNLTEKQVEFAKSIGISGVELLEMINEILDLAKIESGKVNLETEDIKLKDFMAGLEGQFSQTAAQKGLEFISTLDDDVPSTICTDPHRLGQVMKNLLSNAFKFTEEGKVHLRVSRVSSEINSSDSSTPASGSLRFTVSDTGIGIPSQKQELIFKAFQQADGTTDRKYGGTGLGLSICRQLANLLGGQIHLSSQPGQGSSFSLIIPLSFEVAQDPQQDQPQQAQRGQSEPIESPVRPSIINPLPQVDSVQLEDDFVQDDRDRLSKGDKSILIVEDDLDCLSFLTEMVRDRGFAAIVAGDGTTGLQLAKDYLPSAILLDIRLPGVSGLAVISRLKEDLQTRHIPVHVISGVERRADAMRLGAAGFLAKPITADSMAGAFARIEDITSGRVQNLLVVEDNESEANSIKELLANDDVKITLAQNGNEVFHLMEKESFDCIILDLNLPDISGLEVLEKIRQGDDLERIPVVVFTGKELSDEERALLDKHAERVIPKDGESAEHLVDEVALFLHRVEKDLPEVQRKMIHMLYDREAILHDKTVMIVDDDMRNVFALTNVLESKGLKLEIARNGVECLDILAGDAQVDLILMDIMMPEMDGYEAMKQIRGQDRFKDLPIIALTAKAMKEDRAKCIEAGASDYMAKPIDIEKLISMLRAWLYKCPNLV